MFVHIDTFHMNIEEPDMPASVRRNGPLLGYAHVAESHRGALGTGNLELAAYLRALAEAGYRGDLTFEGFSSRMLGPDLVGSVRLWREAWQDSAAAARSALELLRAGWTSAQTAVAAAQ